MAIRGHSRSKLCDEVRWVIIAFAKATVGFDVTPHPHPIPTVKKNHEPRVFSFNVIDDIAIGIGL